ncbi:MAG: CBS domain-containing protein [Polyangiales bacterium]
MYATIEQVMTGTPLTIGAEQTLETAAEMMAEFGVRHLPVRREGHLVGLISVSEARDRNRSPFLPVSAAMVREPMVVAPEDNVADVVARMAERRHEAAIVVAGERVVGIFTATDAERMLAAMLRNAS